MGHQSFNFATVSPKLGFSAPLHFGMKIFRQEQNFPTTINGGGGNCHCWTWSVCCCFCWSVSL